MYWNISVRGYRDDSAIKHALQGVEQSLVDKGLLMQQYFALDTLFG